MSSDSELTMAVNATFNSIVHEIQLSNLNFMVNMTPYAAYITLKKSTQVDRNGSPLSPSPPVVCQLEQAVRGKYEAEMQIIRLKGAIEELTKDKDDLKSINEILADKLLVANGSLSSLQASNESYKKQLLKAECDKKVTSEKLRTAEKHLSELAIGSEHQISALRKEIKVKEKDIYNLSSKSTNFQDTIATLKSELSQVRASKTKIDKDYRKLNEKLKKIESRYQKTASSQTVSTIDTPYLVTDPLPNIFSSKLCWDTKSHFLSNSVPNLEQVKWVTTGEDDDLCEKAEQALSDVYDIKVATFYEEARLEAATARMNLNPKS